MMSFYTVRISVWVFLWDVASIPIISILTSI